MPEPLTTWRAIRALPAGASMTVDSPGARDPVPYHSIAEVYVEAEALTQRRVSEDEFRQDLPTILAAMDQPSIDGVNTWFVAKAARELGLKVAISDLGGDELFGGYPSFRDVPS